MWQDGGRCIPGMSESSSCGKRLARWDGALEEPGWEVHPNPNLSRVLWSRVFGWMSSGRCLAAHTHEGPNDNRSMGKGPGKPLLAISVNQSCW